LPVPLNALRFEPTSIAIAYRWATLMVGLLIALLAATRPGSERAILLAPIAAAGVISVLAIRPDAARWLPVALAVEVAVAVVAIWVTGHYDSPLLLYLSAPAIHAAAFARGRLMAGLQAMAVALFVGAVAVDPDVFTFRPGATIRDVSMLVLLPVLVLATRVSSERDGRLRPSLELGAEDRVVASRLAAGQTYKEIGDELDMSPETVKVAVARVYRRVGARNRDEAVRVINDLGIVEGTGPASPPRG